MAETRDSLLAAARRLLELTGQGPYYQDPILGEDVRIEAHTLWERLRPVYFAATGYRTNLNPDGPWTSAAHEHARQCIGFLNAHPDWQVPQHPRQPEPEGWVHPRLWHRVAPVVMIARKSGKPEDWARVAREATIFLEGELRQRSGTKAKARKQVALDALKPGAACPIGAETAEQEAWQQLGTGLLAGPSNEAVHHPGERTEPYAMGVVGTVSLILAALDQQHGAP